MGVVCMIRTSWRFWRDASGLLLIRAAAVSALLAVAGTACDPGPEITWVNETDQTVVLYLRDQFEPDFGTTVQPHSTKIEGVIQAVWKDVVVIRD
jgi:hypothetical protein